jgi:hypothetical protein
MGWRLLDGNVSPSHEIVPRANSSKGAPIAGYLLEAYGKGHPTLEAYHPAMLYAGSMASGASVMVVLARLKINTTLLKKV